MINKIIEKYKKINSDLYINTAKNRDKILDISKKIEIVIQTIVDIIVFGFLSILSYVILVADMRFFTKLIGLFLIFDLFIKNYGLFKERYDYLKYLLK